MSFTTGAFKTIFWTRVAGAAFTSTSPKAQAKREIRAEEYWKQVEEEKRKILTRGEDVGWTLSPTQRERVESFINRNNDKVASFNRL